MKALFSSRKRNDVALAWELAFGFLVKQIEITLDLRFTYNLTLPKELEERVHADNQTGSEVEAGHTVDGRIMLGVGYVFTAGK